MSAPKFIIFLLRFLSTHVRIKVIYTTDGTVGATEGGTDHREYKQQEPTVWAVVRNQWVLFLWQQEKAAPLLQTAVPRSSPFRQIGTKN